MVHAASAGNSRLSLQFPSWQPMVHGVELSDASHERSESFRTLFGDVIRVGQMIAAVNHAGRRPGKVFSVLQSSDELRDAGPAYSKE